MSRQMTPEEWQNMAENDYAPNPAPEWVDYVFAIVVFVVGGGVGGGLIYALLVLAKTIAGML